MSFIRASLVVNCQLTLAFLVFLAFCQASTSFFTSEMLLIHRFKHCPLKTFNSISAMFNQLPCFGVYTNSNRFQRALAFSGGNVSYRAPGPWVFRLSMTNVMSCAFLYSLAIVFRNRAQSHLVFVSRISKNHFPANSSQTRDTLYVPPRRYS